MTKRPLSDCSVEEFGGTLRSARVTQRTVAAIFGLTMLVWIFGGHVDQNTPMFISTVAMAIAILAVQHASNVGLAQRTRKPEIDGVLRQFPMISRNRH